MNFLIGFLLKPRSWQALFAAGIVASLAWVWHDYTSALNDAEALSAVLADERRTHAADIAQRDATLRAFKKTQEELAKLEADFAAAQALIASLSESEAVCEPLHSLIQTLPDLP